MAVPFCPDDIVKFLTANPNSTALAIAQHFEQNKKSGRASHANSYLHALEKDGKVVRTYTKGSAPTWNIKLPPVHPPSIHTSIHTPIPAHDPTLTPFTPFNMSFKNFDNSIHTSTSSPALTPRLAEDIKDFIHENIETSDASEYFKKSGAEKCETRA